MTKAQRDLLAASYNKRIEASYDRVRQYASSFKKYDCLTVRDIIEVVEKLKELGKKK